MAQFRGHGKNKQYLEQGKNKYFRVLGMNNEKGQIAIEAVLLATVLIAFFLAVKNQLQSKQVFQKITTSSIKRVKHMSEYGTWKDVCKPVAGSSTERAANCHPNSINRSLSSAPD